MRRRLEIVAYALVTSSIACGGNGPLTSNAGTAGGAAGIGAAGSTGMAGAAGQAGAKAALCGAATRPDGTCVINAYPHPKGVCACQDDTPCACGDACVDPSSDDDNCGACGHACAPTATCTDGFCGPPVVTVVPARPGCQSIDVAVSGDRIVFADKGHGQVLSVALAGGAVTTIATGESAPTRVAVNGSTIFWLDEGTKTIRKSVAGGVPSTVLTSMLDIGGFVVTPDGASVYFSSDTTVSRVLAAGGAPVVVAREAHSGLPKALALNGSTLAFPTALNLDVDVVTLVEGQIATCGAFDANDNNISVNCVRIGRGQGLLFLEGILAPAGHVVWADGSEIRDADLSDGSPGRPNMSVVGTTNDISGLAMMAGTIWFSDDSGIYRVADVPNSTAARIARQQNAPRSVAVGATKVIWSTGDCTIESTGL